MPSQALVDWQTRLAARLDELLEMHAKATGTNRGRRWGTQQFNGQLFVALVGQFQGYARALHDEALDWLRGHGPVSTVLAEQASLGRQLDKGNPHQGTLGADFARLGLALIGEVKRSSASGERRLHRLDRAVKLRDGIAHNDPAKIRLAADGPPGNRAVPTLASFRVHRRALDGLARDMDAVVAQHLGTLLSTQRPW